MKYKKVFFGRTMTTQVQCPECKTWQFEDETCCDCGVILDYEKDDQKAIEFRSEVNTWRKMVSQATRKKVYERDDFICQFCSIWCYDSWSSDKRSVTVDHLVPVTGCGSDDIDNLVTCCRECNGIKGNKRFDTFEKAKDYILKRKKTNIKTND